MKGLCKNCKKERDIFLSGKSKGLCNICYKKLLWKPKFLKCKRCNRIRVIHAKGLCDGCYNSVFHIERQKKRNLILSHKIPIEIYEQIVKSCAVCGFEKIVDLHHLDHDHSNNSEKNMIGLCPNHHRMLHDRRFSKELIQLLKEKGHNPKEEYPDDEFFKK